MLIFLSSTTETILLNLFSTYTCCLRFYALKTPIWLFLFSIPLYHFSETCLLQSGLLRHVRTTRMVKGRTIRKLIGGGGGRSTKKIFAQGKIK